MWSHFRSAEFPHLPLSKHNWVDAQNWPIYLWSYPTYTEIKEKNNSPVCSKMKEFAKSFNFKHPLKQKFVKRMFKMQKAEFG